jgi:Chemotaxis protein histidine kinase and related kinases
MISSLSKRIQIGIGSMVLAFAAASVVSVFGVVASAREVSRIISLSEPTVAALGKTESGIVLQQSFVAVRSDATRVAWRSIALLGALTFAAIGVGAVLGARLTRQIRAPIGRLVEGMGQIALGDRAARLEDVGVDEFRELESGFNDMAERLEEAEQGLRRSLDGQRKILDEIPVGFLTIGPDFRVGPEYSVATERILGRSDIAGTHFPELIFERSNSQGIEGLKRFLKQVFENRTADKDFLDEINPVSSISIEEKDGERDVAIRFDRIYEDGKVVDLLATIEDKTEAIEAGRALEEEKRQHKRDSDSIQAILSIGPGPLKDFFSETRELIARIRSDLGRLDDAAAIHACFRSLHSIKGAAGSFGIEAIAMTAHEAEDIFSALRDSGRAPTTQELVRINVLLGTIGQELDAFEDMVLRLKSTLARLEYSDSLGAQRSELEEFGQSLSLMVEQLGRTLSKPMELALDLSVSELPHLREMRNVIIHLIRNAADHGLEDEYERLFHGKDKRGKIKLSVRGEGDGPSLYLIDVEDDGQGLDFERIAARGVERGLVPASEAGALNSKRLLSLLFMPGFSTKDKADEISGRGVGLDLVRDTVRSLGGRIAVTSIRGKGTKFSISIPA